MDLSLEALAADRRMFLATMAAGMLAVLAGCQGAGSPGASPGAPTGAGAPTATKAARTGQPGQRSGLVFPRGPARPLLPVPAPHPGPARVVFSAPGGPGSTPQVALTIDDGYDPPTVAHYVEFARLSGIPITFSPNGVYQRNWNGHAAVLRPLIEAGQVQIGNHTYTHRNMLGLTDAAVRADIERNEEWIERTFGITSRPWFRPPFGRHSARTDEVAGQLGYTRILMWEGSFGDARLLTPAVLLDQARQWLTGGRIVLGHANHPTVTHLYGQLLTLIQQRGLRPVTLDTMFGTSRATG